MQIFVIRLKPNTNADFIIRLKPNTTADFIIRLKLNTTADFIIRLKPNTTCRFHNQAKTKHNCRFYNQAKTKHNWCWLPYTPSDKYSSITFYRQILLQREQRYPQPLEKTYEKVFTFLNIFIFMPLTLQ